MIGQTTILQKIDFAIAKNKFPRFLVIRGVKGSGKKELVKYIANKFECETLFFGTSVESIRQLITTCYQQTKKLLYVITDAEKLSANAENALLKVVEEPPRNAYIILTINSDSLLATINSRATTICMAEYSRAELKQYAQDILKLKTNIDELLDICDTPGELLTLSAINYNTVFDYCENVVNLIGKANIGSALRIALKIKLREKDEENNELFNLDIFLKVLSHIYYLRCQDSTGNTEKFMLNYTCWQYVFEAIKQINKNYNKQYIVDELILNLRKVNHATV